MRRFLLGVAVGASVVVALLANAERVDRWLEENWPQG